MYKVNYNGRTSYVSNFIVVFDGKHDLLAIAKFLVSFLVTIRQEILLQFQNKGHSRQLINKLKQTCKSFIVRMLFDNI